MVARPRAQSEHEHDEEHGGEGEAETEAEEEDDALLQAAHEEEKRDHEPAKPVRACAWRGGEPLPPAD